MRLALFYCGAFYIGHDLMNWLDARIQGRRMAMPVVPWTQKWQCALVGLVMISLAIL